MGRRPAQVDADVMDIIDAYLEHLRRESKCDSAATVAGRRDILIRLHRQLPFGLTLACREELEEWLHNPDTGWKQGTKATYWACIRSFYRWAADPRDPWLTEDPTVYMTPVATVKGIARDITDEQLWTILEDGEPWIQVPARLAAYQGLRDIEISGLDREHVTEQRLIVVRGKGGAPRVHDTDQLVWEALRDLPPGPVCRRPDGRRAGPAYISARASRIFQQDLGLEGVTMHRLRHWLGVRVQAEYRDVRVTQEMLGHASLSSTQIYTKATVQQQRAARATLPRPRAGG
jgi:integrase/recombinase XerC